MANVKISELPVAPNVCQTGIVPIVQDGCTYSATAAQLSPMSRGVGACSIIGNGVSNTANGDCSFVAGSGNAASGTGSFVAGQGNTAAASYSGAFGCGVTNNLPCTFMANNFVACDIMNCVSCAVCIDSVGKFGTYYYAPPLQPVFCASFNPTGSIQTTVGSNQAYGSHSGSLGGTNNTACCNCANVLNGSFNISAGNNSFIGNGQSNCVCNSNFSSVTNGFGNYINFANQAFIGTGLCNCVSSEKSSIVGGEYNAVQSGGATGGFIGGGCCNIVAGVNSAVLGGCGNTANCSYTFVAGCGLVNNTQNSFMVNDLVIGTFNGFSGCYVGVDSVGKLCISTGTAAGSSGSSGESGSSGSSGESGSSGSSGSSGPSGSPGFNGSSGSSGNSGTSPMVVGFGTCSIVGNCVTAGNNAQNCYSFVGGGCNNNACADFGSILGGCGNTVSGLYSSVLGGEGNSASGSYSFVAGCGLTNAFGCTFMANNFIIGDFQAGYNGCSLALDASGKMCLGGGGGASPMVVGTGCCSIVGNCSLSNLAGAACSFVGGGCFNNNNGPSSFIGGGTCNGVSATNQVITGGSNNCLGSCYAYGTLGGGFFNQASCGFQPFPGVTIAGGVGNSTTGGTFDTNCACWSINPSASCMGAFSFIGGGFQNNAQACQSIVVGGKSNIVCGMSSFIGGGECNCITSFCSTIVAGLCNTISCTGFANAIVGGYCNKIFNGSYHQITNGQCNTIGCTNFSACNNTIVSGNKGYVDGQFGFIGNSSDCGVFGSCSNRIACGTYGGTILNGQCNTICGSFSPGVTNCFSTILGGANNSASCCFNVIYGCGNFAMGNFTNAFGCGLSAMSGCTTFFNNVCVCGTLSKMSGSFKIPHPDPVKAEAGKFLKHSFVESPTAGDNIYRFKVSTINLSATIELPDYYKFLNENDQVWVSPVGHFGIAYGTVNADQTAVDLVSNADGEFNVLVIGTRKDKVAKDYWNGIEVNEVENEEEYQRVLALKKQMAIDNVKRAEEDAAYILEEAAKAEKV